MDSPVEEMKSRNLVSDGDLSPEIKIEIIENETLDFSSAPSPIEEIEISSVAVKAPTAAVVKGNKFSCQLCLKSFKLQKVLNKHMKENHNEEQTFDCPMCPNSYKESWNLNNHIKLSHNDKAKTEVVQEFPCDECDEVFLHSRDYSSHMQTIHLEEYPFPCQGCSKEFKELPLLNSHIKVAHHKDKTIKIKLEQRFICPVCSEKFLESKDLKCHMKTAHDRDDAFQCPNCVKAFKEFRQMNLHVKLVHSGEKRFACHICSNRFNFRANLTRHIREIHQLEKNFLCQECPMAFGQKTTLEKHVISVHGKEGDFKCDQCTTTFAFAYELNRHVKIVHLGERKFLCHHCPRKFALRSNLTKHLSEKTCAVERARYRKRSKKVMGPGGQVQPLEQLIFKCEICVKQFNNSGNLKRHHRDVHERKQNHECPECGKKFSQKETVERHRVSVHAVEGAFKCDKCPLNFAYGYELDSHVKCAHFGEKRRRRKIQPQSDPPKEKDSESCDNSSSVITLQSTFVPEKETRPPSPEILVVNLVTKDEAIDCSQPSYFLDSNDDNSFMQTDEISLTDLVISEMEPDLKFKIYQAFKNYERSEIISLIGKRVLNQSDLINVVVHADKANLKTAELIEAVIESFMC